MTTPFPLIEVAGPASVRGRQYGELARGRIRLGIDHYSEQLRRLSVGPDGIAGIVRNYLPIMQAFEPTYLEEMRGIAEGAGVSLEDIVLINARTEIVKLAARPDLRRQLAGAADEPDGCTALVVSPAASADSRLIMAQNWDWKEECVDTSVVLCIRRDDGPDVLTFTEAGGLARSGVNSAGIGIIANYLESDRDYSRIGVPLPMIRRKALDSEHFALALHAVYTTEKSASSNMIVGHRGGIAIDLECAPDETFPVHFEDGLIVHSNHWQSPVALSRLKEGGIMSTPDSLYRDIRVRQLLGPKVGGIRTEDVKAALADDFETPWSICRPPRRGVNGVRTATVATIVIDPLEGTLTAAPLPALGMEFTDYALNPANGTAASRDRRVQPNS
jgi:isopenicillin-N N-acyltransferase-like protein